MNITDITSSPVASSAATSDVAPPDERPSAGRTARTRRGRRRVAVATVIGSIGALALLTGCGQNFEQDAGVIPVPQASTEGARTMTPAPAPDAPEVIGPGYAPPRNDRPTQTAVPNIPGGKL